MAKPYQLRYTYDPDQIIGTSAIHSRHEHIDEAAEAFLSLTAPYKQVVVEEDGKLAALDEREESRLQEICDAAGYDVDEIEA
jgi:hypothetical protein